jgi:GT2 family glycosyltransferase
VIEPEGRGGALKKTMLKESGSYTWPRISVIIPNFNGAAFLGPCLDSLARQVFPARKVIVVDNGSSDESRRIVESHSLKPEWIGLSVNRGFSAAVNIGIRKADTDAVALLNNDAEADPRWLLFGAKALAEYPDAGFFASLILRRVDQDRVDSAGACYARDGRPYPYASGERAARCNMKRLVLAASAGAAFFPRRLFEEIGFFDEAFFAYLEDVDLCLRAGLLGKTGMFLPEAVVYHHGVGTDLGDRPGPRPADSEMRVRWIARNKIFILARDLPASLLLRWCPWILLGLAKSAAYHLFRSGQAPAFFSGTWQGIRAVPGLMAERHELQRRRKITPRELAKRMREGAGATCQRSR